MRTRASPPPRLRLSGPCCPRLSGPRRLRCHVRRPPLQSPWPLSVSRCRLLAPPPCLKGNFALPGDLRSPQALLGSMSSLAAKAAGSAFAAFASSKFGRSIAAPLPPLVSRCLLLLADVAFVGKNLLLLNCSFPFCGVLLKLFGCAPWKTESSFSPSPARKLALKSTSSESLHVMNLSSFSSFSMMRAWPLLVLTSLQFQLGRKWVGNFLFVVELDLFVELVNMAFLTVALLLPLFLELMSLAGVVVAPLMIPVLSLPM